MKKSFCCVLCVFLCLFLCSCQSEHSSLLTLLENKEYSEAIDYINRLARADMDAQQNDKDSHPLIPYLYGTWEGAVDEDVPIFQFNEDGTCLVDGQAHLWCETIVKNTVDNRVQVDVLRGDKLVYVFQLVKWTDGICSGSANKMKNDTNYIDHFSNLRNRSHYERVEITEENWETYFEIVRDMTTEKFSFPATRLEEASSYIGITEKIYLSLKNEHFGRLDTTFSQITAECEFRFGSQPILYDWNTDTYTLTGDFVPNYYPVINNLSLQTINGNRFGQLINASWNVIPEDSTENSFILPRYIDQIQVATIKGTLYFSKEVK